MSKVSYKEKLKENVLNSSWKEELKVSHEIRECIIRFIDGLSEEDAALLLSQDEKREVITIETKNVPLIVNPEEKNPEKLIRSSEDLGVIKYDRPLPRIADMLFLYAASPETRRKSAEEQADLYWEKLADAYNFVEKYSARRVETSLILATKLTQEMQEATSRNKAFSVKETWKNKKNGKANKTPKLQAAFIMPSLNEDGVIIPKEAGVTNYDLAMQDAYISCRVAGNVAITYAMICNARSGSQRPRKHRQMQRNSRKNRSDGRI